ncbi:MAG TPA: hypothetical protein VK504_25325 [Vicinamibacterales bacterium]|nr:hypothetical protein [Vicinamibacterales bacterium]
MPPLPFLNTYNDPKVQRAYERYLSGESQRKILKSVKIAPRTLARRCKDDGWEAERQARRVAAEASQSLPSAAAGESVAPEVIDATDESRLTTIDRMLREWQVVTGHLRRWVVSEAHSLFTPADGKRPRLQQVMQLGVLTERLASLDKKVHCVPDKIETKDTTPKDVDRVRSLTDEQLEREREEAARALAASRSRAPAPASVN